MNQVYLNVSSIFLQIQENKDRAVRHGYTVLERQDLNEAIKEVKSNSESKGREQSFE
eukprot:CAMPEP_0185587130 /NCGR_PEP_ID=MMETSP0434-20130131/47639_1 /TAXON_ID=626734 ORGANISM="Favella taraikaensis, Strain Fe Narragansett Bay" /NCGR_SAMPLE_ID=MMETSP0434 /ASSEMBLY_ACC=CAM_ASM_000379 /LENGTH=56 /DNA_ID=CAMNT_0028208783 /DNA_START=261 /DNA_END=428 /DNA_ORIENTATION=+